MALFGRRRRRDPKLVAQIVAIAEAMLAEQGVQRPVSLNEPLGAEGLGLDSVARLDLLGKIEKQCGVKVPEKYWGTKPLDSLRHLLDVIR
jgi:acyl carrier protein